jgi:hypothetical protein
MKIQAEIMEKKFVYWNLESYNILASRTAADVMTECALHEYKR